MNKRQEIPINRGVELMLRREKKEENKKGIHLHKIISLLNKKIQITFDFSWEGS
jgi:hypothetical protein